MNGDNGAGHGVTPSNTAYRLYVLGNALFDSQHPVAELGGANARRKAQKDVSMQGLQYLHSQGTHLDMNSLEKIKDSLL
jgi:hypothetical protein